MPVVPIARGPKAHPQRKMPDEPWALMAAAQMHSEGRLVEPDTEGGPLPPQLGGKEPS